MAGRSDTSKRIFERDNWFEECFHFSLTTMTTIGYGDFAPLNPELRRVVGGQQLMVLLFACGILGAKFRSGGGAAATDADTATVIGDDIFQGLLTLAGTGVFVTVGLPFRARVIIIAIIAAVSLAIKNAVS